MPYAMLLLTNPSSDTPLPSIWPQEGQTGKQPSCCKQIASNLLVIQMPEGLQFLGKACAELERFHISYKTSFFTEEPVFS